MRLNNRTAIITGGANGIGRATGQRFAEEGAAVAIWDLDKTRGQELARELTALGKEALYQEVDVTDSAAVDDAVQKVLDSWGQIDILVNNAGILRDGQLVKVKEGQLQKQMSDDMFKQVIDVNLMGVFIGARAVAPAMIKREKGVILNTTSIVGIDGNFGQTNYVAAKAGVIGMTKVWARELGRYGIRVNAVAPGFTATEMVLAMPEKILQGMKKRTPLGRLGEPLDVANAFVFLASDEASFISGATLRVDGGIVVGT